MTRTSVGFGSILDAKANRKDTLAHIVEVQLHFLAVLMLASISFLRIVCFHRFCSLFSMASFRSNHCRAFPAKLKDGTGSTAFQYRAYGR